MSKLKSYIGEIVSLLLIALFIAPTLYIKLVGINDTVDSLWTKYILAPLGALTLIGISFGLIYTLFSYQSSGIISLLKKILKRTKN